jgi:transposase InsO family protein
MADAALAEQIRAIHTRSRGTYGAPRVRAELVAAGERVGCKRIARLMRAAGLAGVSRREGLRTTRRADDARPAPDLVDRNFAASAPNRLWVADITYVPTWAGFLYLAVVLDAFSRRVIGWSMATHLRTARARRPGDGALAAPTHGRHSPLGPGLPVPRWPSGNAAARRA